MTQTLRSSFENIDSKAAMGLISVPWPQLHFYRKSRALVLQMESSDRKGSAQIQGVGAC